MKILMKILYEITFFIIEFKNIGKLKKNPKEKEMKKSGIWREIIFLWLKFKTFSQKFVYFFGKFLSKSTSCENVQFSANKTKIFIFFLIFSSFTYLWTKIIETKYFELWASITFVCHFEGKVQCVLNLTLSWQTFIQKP